MPFRCQSSNNLGWSCESQLSGKVRRYQREEGKTEITSPSRRQEPQKTACRKGANGSGGREHVYNASIPSEMDARVVRTWLGAERGEVLRH